MKSPSSLIQFKQFGFDFICDIKMEETWKSMTDNLTVKLPRAVFNYKEENRLDKKIKVGEPMRASLGYDDKLTVVFDGFVSVVKPTTPVEVVCEDAMYEYKQAEVKSKSWKEAALKDVLTHVGINNAVTQENIKLGRFTIDSKTGSVSAVLQKLKDEYYLHVFFRKGKLHVGRLETVYNKTGAKEANFAFGQNIISHSLEFKTKDEVKIKVKAVANLGNGKKLEAAEGDSGGAEQTLNFNDKYTEPDLKAVAKSEFDRMSYDGWRGKFLAFGEPYITHGDIVKLIDEVDKDKSGKYWVNAVSRTGGTGGYRQEIELGPLVK